jgi:uncharacterized protein YutE (UPF0331/DUF86 family)
LVLGPEAVKARLLRLEEVVSRLRDLAGQDPQALRRGFRDAWAAERDLQVAAEIVFDIGNHVLTAHFGASATDYEDIIARLESHGVIDHPLRERLRGLVGFRNILVHGYLSVDPDRVVEALGKAPSEFSDFENAVREWLNRTVV